MDSGARPCPFCNPKERILKETERVYIMISNPRKMPGHLLVIPKRHVEKSWELSREELTEVFELIHGAEERLLQAGFATGFQIRQNYFPFVEENRFKVNHVHFHILPRTFKDEFYQKVDSAESALFADLPEEEIVLMQKLLG